MNDNNAAPKPATTNDSKKKKNGRRRPKSKIGMGAEAIRRWDEQQEGELRWAEITKRFMPNRKNIPTFQQVEKNYRQNPVTNRLECNLHGGKWRIVICTEEFYDTCFMELESRNEWDTIKQYKSYMMNKYHVLESDLDYLFAPLPEEPEEEDDAKKPSTDDVKKPSTEDAKKPSTEDAKKPSTEDDKKPSEDAKKPSTEDDNKENAKPRKNKKKKKQR